MKVGIVILNYNVSDSVIKLVANFQSYQCIDAIVIVDNASDEEEREKLTKEYNDNTDSKITFLQSTYNGGYAKGNNIGLRYLVNDLCCDICVVCNPDIDILEVAFEQFITFFHANSYFGVLTCSRRYSDGMAIRQYWELADFRTLILECLSLYRRKERTRNIYEVPEDKTLIEIGVAPGAFWAVKSEVLKKVNYMDEGTFLYYEESCFAKKILNHGYKEGLYAQASYTIYRDKASTTSVRKNGKGFEYLLDSKDFYLKNYLNCNKYQVIIWKIFLCIARIENLIKHIGR